MHIRFDGGKLHRFIFCRTQSRHRVETNKQTTERKKIASFVISEAMS